MSKEIGCDGSRVHNSIPAKLPEGGWGVRLPVFDPHLRYGANYHTIESPQVNQQSTITWAGPLGCFPAETPRNKQVKQQLIGKHGADAFFAVVDNPKETHLASITLSLVPDGETYEVVYPCEGCPKFAKYRNK